MLAEGDFSFASGERAARQLLGLADPATAIIASNDQMSLATLDVARDLELSVPADLSLISFDDTPIVRFTVPTLTAVTSRSRDRIARGRTDHRLPPRQRHAR